MRATGRLNRLYVELLKDNLDWGTPERRHDLNQFMARLIFCFFAEDTGIFLGESLFTDTVRQMSDAQAGNTHEVIAELFRAMDTRIEARLAAGFRPGRTLSLTSTATCSAGRGSAPASRAPTFYGSANCPGATSTRTSSAP